MTLAQLRRSLYRSASLLGDVQAARRGPNAMAKRALRKAMWRLIASLIAKATRGGRR